MIFIKRNKKAINDAGSKAFGFLNSRILKVQTRLANQLNSWINRLSRRGQKRVLWIFIVFSFCGISVRLIVSIIRPGFGERGNHYTLPKINLKSTDSLTTKK